MTDNTPFGNNYEDIRLMLSTDTTHIYRARRADKDLLIKTAADSQSHTQLLNLQREYKKAVNLTHPGLASVYTWDADTPVGPSIVMEYVAGRSLRDYLEEEPTLRERNLVIDRLLDAVAYLHSRGVVHNGINLDNIIVGFNDNRVCLIDFADINGDASTTLPLPTDTDEEEDTEALEAQPDIHALGKILHALYGSRYRGVQRRCHADKPGKGYKNVMALKHALTTARRMPLMIAAGIGSALLVALIVWLIIAACTRPAAQIIDNYDYESVEITDTTAYVDTIRSLREQNALALDSIAALNAKINGIDANKSLNDSLSLAYKKGFNAIADKLIAEAKSKKCREETTYVLGKVHDVVLTYDKDFAARNRDGGNDVVNTLSVNAERTLYAQLNDISSSKKTLAELVGTGADYNRILQLINEGKSWEMPKAPAE